MDVLPGRGVKKAILSRIEAYFHLFWIFVRILALSRRKIVRPLLRTCGIYNDKGCSVERRWRGLVRGQSRSICLFFYPFYAHNWHGRVFFFLPLGHIPPPILDMPD